MTTGAAASRRDFLAATRAEVAGHAHAAGAPGLHAATVFRAAYRAGLDEPWRAAGLPRALAGRLAGAYVLAPPRIAEERASEADGSRAFRLALADGAAIESVLVPERRRVTLCVSSQVGCAQACTFCRTATMGLARNLTAGEIVGQVLVATRWLESHPAWLAERGLGPAPRVTNLVFMGMGEPLDNADEVARALDVLTDVHGLALAERRITVSTAGHLDGLARLRAARPGVRIALSLHAARDELRSALVPLNRRWPLGELRAAIAAAGSPVLLQVTLIGGVNDGVREADELVAWTRGLDVKVNLIPLNDVGRARLVPPTEAAVVAFRNRLHAAGLRVMVRHSKGPDVGAACGQLAVRPAARAAR